MEHGNILCRLLAEERIHEWGGNVELSQTQETGPSESTVASDARN
jgi:hypothetical protein